MTNRTRRAALGSLAVWALAAAYPAAAVAAEFDGSRSLLCAPVDVAECGIGPKCTSATLEEANVPHFIRVDFKAKKLSGRDHEGDVESTPIQNVRSVNGATILQGAESGRAWSLVVDHDTGQMMGSVTGFTPTEERLGFLLFGACTAD